MTVRAETQIDLTRVDDGTPGAPGANGATFTPSVSAAGDISWTNDGGLPNPATQNIKGPAGNTPYIQGGYWYINGTSTGVKAEGDDGTTSVWYYGNKITGTSTTPTVFSGSGIATAVVGDMYLNTDNSNVYQCTLGGNASTAKWVYAGTIADGIITVKSVNGSVASFADASEYPALEVITDINAKQAGSGTPSPSNPRAISGYTAINTFADGKNLLHHIYPTNTVNYVTFTLNADYSVTANGTASANAERSLTYRTSGTYGTCWLKAGTYKLLGCPSGGGSTKYEIGVNTTINGSGVTLARDYGSGATFTLANDGLVGTWITVRNGVTVNNLVFKPMIVVSTETDTTYEPYNGNTYTTPLPSTVYGGTLDVTKGLLTVTHAIYTYIGASGESWSASGTYQGSFYINTGVGHNKYTNNVWCSHATYVQTMGSNYAYGKYALDGSTPDNKFINIWIQNAGTTVSQWKQYLADQNTAGTPLQIVLELATSQTYNVPPQQIQLLQGTNNVWTDSGDVDVKYAIISAGAVEALREPIDNASKVATSYITQIDEGGIKVHDAGDTTNYAKLDSNGMQIYQSGTQVANFDSDSVDLGMNGVSSEITLCDSAGIISAWRANSLNALNIFSVPPSATYPYSRVHITPQTRGSNGTYHEYAWCDLESGTGGGSISFTVEDPNDFYNGEKLEFKAGYPLKLFCNGYSENQAQFHIDDGSTEVWIGVGAGGTNHGLYSETESAWIAMSDGSANYTGNSFGPYVTSTNGNDGYFLGWSTHRWRSVLTYNAPNYVSDRKHKNEIGDIDFAKDLIMGLRPIEFQWKNSDRHKRSHMGLIAQETAELGKKLGKDLAFYEAHYVDGSDYYGEETDDENLEWGMMYTELIAPLIKVVQEQQHEIDELKERIEALERK